MTIRPLHDRVVVRRIEAEARSAGGIVIPDSASEKPDQGEILAVGPGAALDDGGTRPPAPVRSWATGTDRYPERPHGTPDERSIARRADRRRRRADTLGSAFRRARWGRGRLAASSRQPRWSSPMYLVKASAPVLDTVRRQNKQLFRGEPRDWEADEPVLFIRNKGDLEEGEKPIAVTARIAKIRPVEGSEAADLASGVKGQFRFVAEYEDVTELVAPFDLEEAIGERAADAYKRVTIARKVEGEDATKLGSFLKARAPAEPKSAKARPAAEEVKEAKEAKEAPAAPAKDAPAKKAPAKAAATKADRPETRPATPPPAEKTPAPQAAATKAETAKPASGKPTEEKAEQVPPAYLPWYLETVELSRLSLAFFAAGAFLLGAVMF